MDSAALIAQLVALIALGLSAWTRHEATRNKHQAELAASKGEAARIALEGWIALTKSQGADIERLRKTVEHCETQHAQAREEIRILRDAGRAPRPFGPPPDAAGRPLG